VIVTRSVYTLSRRGRPFSASLAGIVDIGSSYRSSSIEVEAYRGGDRGRVAGLVRVLKIKV